MTTTPTQQQILQALDRPLPAVCIADAIGCEVHEVPPGLRALKDEGLIEVDDWECKPGGTLRRLYRLTQKGLKQMAEFNSQQKT